MLDKIAAVIYVITFGFAYYRMFVLPKGNRKLKRCHMDSTDDSS